MAGKSATSKYSQGVNRGRRSQAATSSRAGATAGSNSYGTSSNGSQKAEYSAAYARAMKEREERKKAGLPEQF